MSSFNEEDLQFNDYKWNAIDGDNPKVTGKPDSTLLNRHEGYEVLYFINKMYEIHGIVDANKRFGQEIEHLIHEKLPSNIRSQENVRAWIEDYLRL